MKANEIRLYDLNAVNTTIVLQELRPNPDVQNIFLYDLDPVNTTVVMRYFGEVIAPAGNVTLTTGLGSLIINGFEPTINLSVTVTSDVGQLVINGLSPVINTQIISQVGSVVIDGFAPLVNQNIISGLGQLTLSGFAPTISLIAGGVTVTPSFGQLILTGFSPTIIVPEIIDPPALQIQVENRYSLGRVTTKRPYQRRY